MFENKLNYLTAAMALGLLLLLGRFGYMQVVAHDHYAGQAEAMRTGMTLLEPQRAEIRLAGGQLVARTESVWDVYLDLERFADPRGIARRAHFAPAHYDAAAVQAFVDGPLKAAQDAALAAPSARRRFFLLWKLREHEVCRRDFELCTARLCLVTGVTREDLEAQVAQVYAEVDSLSRALGDPLRARDRDVSRAWLRARPALTDPEYWARIVRFPKSIRLEPVLAARVQWMHHEQQTLAALRDTADGDRALLRDLCFASVRTFRDKAAATWDPGEGKFAPPAGEAAVRAEEHAVWLRLAGVCTRAMQGSSSLDHRLRELEGELKSASARLERLRKNVLRAWGEDWNSRWQAYGLERSPLLLMRDAPRDVVEMLKVNADELPGVVCVRRPSRHYEFSRELAHVLGQVGLPDADAVEEMAAHASFGEGLEELVEDWFGGDNDRFRERFSRGLSRQLFGVAGVELAYDERLSGLYGARVLARDAAGRSRGIEFEKPPHNAAPLTLTIDIDLQRDIQSNVAQWEPRLAAQAAEKSARMFRNGQIESDRWRDHAWTFRGAAVVLDVKTGAVLALCSFPDYDPRAMSGRSEADRLYQAEIAREQAEERERGTPWWNQSARMFNRARDGLYAPGSTFKVVSAIALLETGTINERSTFDEFGREIRWNGRLLGRTNHPVGGAVDINTAIAESSNGFFYRWVQDLGETPAECWEVLRVYAEMLGIGRGAESDLGNPRRGCLPESDRVWARNLAALAIGQGEMLTTPLELARVYATIAGRGALVVPHIAHEARSEAEQVDFHPRTWDILHRGMRDVVFGGGTGREDPALNRIRCAGKTGTTENGRGVPDHAWFAGFAPYDDPKVAFVILAANSDLAGSRVSPVISECIERHFQRTGVIEKR